MSDLTRATYDRVTARDNLLREFPELEHDETALADTLQGIDDFEERVVAWMRIAREQEAQAKALALMIEEMQIRKRRLEGNAEKLRDVVLEALQAAELGRPIRAPDMTISVSAGRRRKVIVTNDDAIPDTFCKIERTPLKAIIAQELARGINVPGAILSNPVPFLSVRRT